MTDEPQAPEVITEIDMAEQFPNAANLDGF